MSILFSQMSDKGLVKTMVTLTKTLQERIRSSPNAALLALELQNVLQDFQRLCELWPEKLALNDLEGLEDLELEEDLEIVAQSPSDLEARANDYPGASAGASDPHEPQDAD
ncbi:MAG: hypothetical protein LBT38_00130 [Deltaproteobacteria bacterium]|jgi:hypothetical protein|nr:hypothetical protein [Deltaproteobacteria bacterium]